jgi:hypothetical protein
MTHFRGVMMGSLAHGLPRGRDYDEPYIRIMRKVMASLNIHGEDGTEVALSICYLLDGVHCHEKPTLLTRCLQTYF